MWARNLLFVGLLLAGGAVLVSALFPRPPRSRALGSAVGGEEVRSAQQSLDEAFRTTWRHMEVTPAGPASDLTVMRRLALGLMGTIPSLEEIRAFEAAGEDRVNAWLEAVLRDPRFHDYFAERLARAYVGTEDGPFILFRRRRFVSWLSEELAKNRPYDEIVRSLISDQGLWTDHPAVNFLSVTLEDPDKSKPNAERLASRVARAFLATRLDCAQCHNHPFERWKQDDFQKIAAFFGQVKADLRGIHDTADGEYQMEDRKTGARLKVDPGVPFDAELLPAEGTRRQRLAGWVTHPKNRAFARATVNRVWAILGGKPLLEPVDDLTTTGDVPPALERLAEEFVKHQFDLRHLIRLIANSSAFRLDSSAEHELTDAHEKVWAAFPMTRMRPEQMAGSILQAASVQTIDQDSHILTRLARFGGINEFVKRYGDTGDDEFAERGCTIPQVLLVMNGDLVHEKTRGEFLNASTRLGWQALDDRSAVELAFLCVLTRRPSQQLSAHFEARLRDTQGGARSQRMEDIFWTLLNSTEFKWNH